MLEQKVTQLCKRGVIPGLAHPYIGKEGVAAGNGSQSPHRDM
jgi:TPP-dependent pyruvate/acetoin dehydrogenase alpha subunit